MDLAKAFLEQAVRVGATVQETSPDRLVPLGVRILEEAGCRSVAVAHSVPERSAWIGVLSDRGLAEVAPGELSPVRRAHAGLSVARLGVAETGSVLLHSTAEDRRVELCVDVHLVLLQERTLVPGLSEALAVVRELSSRPPAYASLVSGPSRSADIERVLTIGVHGPRALHVLLVTEDPV